MQKRLGFVGIIIENIEEREDIAKETNQVLSSFGHLIKARVGLPYEDRHCCVITLVIDATTDELGLLTGKLGMIKGVSVKSALSKGKKSE